MYKVELIDARTAYRLDKVNRPETIDQSSDCHTRRSSCHRLGSCVCNSDSRILKIMGIDQEALLLSVLNMGVNSRAGRRARKLELRTQNGEVIRTLAYLRIARCRRKQIQTSALGPHCYSHLVVLRHSVRFPPYAIEGYLYGYVSDVICIAGLKSLSVYVFMVTV
jgi:hypothetical protein